MFNTDELSAVSDRRVKQPDLLRKEEIPAGDVHFLWDAKMLPAEDDPGSRG
jgi:hypothetical protein